jgi:hypothetical protein
MRHNRSGWRVVPGTFGETEGCFPVHCDAHLSRVSFVVATDTKDSSDRNTLRSTSKYPKTGSAGKGLKSRSAEVSGRCYLRADTRVWRPVDWALKPGGTVVIEAAYRDATRAMSIGAAVVFDSNELLQMFPGFRILQYEDRLTQADFGPRNTVSRVVRLCAQKP